MIPGESSGHSPRVSGEAVFSAEEVHGDHRWVRIIGNSVHTDLYDSHASGLGGMSADETAVGMLSGILGGIGD